MTKIIFLIVSCLYSVIAEPPVNTYLPATTGSFRGVSSQYGVPSSQYAVPSSQYGVPSSRFGGSSSQYSAPSSQYGTPSRGQFGSYSRGTANQYGAPGVRTPSSLYGAPGFRSSFPSTQFGASTRTPSSLYGSPNYRSRQPSSLYGAPGSDSVVINAADQGSYNQGTYGQTGSGNYFGAHGGYSGSNGGHGRGGYDDDQSEPANYEFSYDVSSPEYAVEFGHQESRQGDSAQGSYYVLLPDGRKQHVEYTADLDGYKPKISYEGTGNGGQGGFSGPGGYSGTGGYSGPGGYSGHGGFSGPGGYSGTSQSGFSSSGVSGQGGYSHSGSGPY